MRNKEENTATNENLGFTTDDFVYQYTNGTNRLAQADGQNGTSDRNYTYDANGNLLTDDFKGISNTVYRRGSYAHSIAKGSDQIDYLYDAGDLRFYKKVQTTAQTTEESTIRDAMGHDLAVVKWIDNTLQPVEYYVYGANRIAQVTSTANNKILNTEATFFLYDHLGNTRVAFTYSIANNTHPYTVVNAMDYYPYGKILREFDNGNGNRYLSTGHERDGETGLDYRGARYYDSDVARFLSTDPLAAKFPAWSTYNYVLGNPIRLVDRDGRAPGDPFTSIDAAAKDFAMIYGVFSIQENREYATNIYSYVVMENGVDKTYYTYQEPVSGKIDGAQVPYVREQEGEAVAGAHTHGAYDPEYNSEEFSLKDERKAETRGVPEYISTPSGALKVLDPKTGSERVVDTNVPHDPNPANKVQKGNTNPALPKNYYPKSEDELKTARKQAKKENQKKVFELQNAYYDILENRTRQ